MSDVLRGQVVRRRHVPAGWAAAALACVAAGTAPADARRVGPGVRMAPPPGWVQAVAADTAAPVPTDQVKDGLHFLLLDRQVLAGAGREVYYHYAKRLVNEAGLDSASQLTVEFDPYYQSVDLHAVRLLRGGAALDQLARARIEILQREPHLEYQIYDGARSVVLFLDDLRVGDVVDYAFTVRGANPVFEGRYFDALSVEWSVPLRHMRYRLLWPRGRHLAVVNHRTSLAPRVTPGAGVSEYVWETFDPPLVSGEDGAPRWHDHWAWVQLSEFQGWDEVAAWGRKLFERPAELPADLVARVEDWRRTRPHTADQVVAALRFVQDEVRYVGIELGTRSHRPSAPREVAQRRFGDCKDKALLFCTLLRRLGVEAAPALVNTDRGRALDDWHPTPLAFNHAVVQVSLDGRRHWLDPTLSAQGGRLGDIHFPDYERALVLRDGTLDLDEVLPRRPPTPALAVRETYAVREDGAPVSYVVETTYSGGEADSTRADLQRRSADDLRRSYRDYYARSYPSIRSLAPVEQEDDRDRNRLVVRERYEIPTFWNVTPETGVKETQLFADTVGARLQAPELAKRWAPFALRHPVHVRHEIEVLLPGERQTPPARLSIANRELRFRYRGGYENGTLRLEYEYSSLTDAVPAARAAEHMRTVERIREALAYTLRSAPQGADKPAAGGLAVAVALIAAALLPLALVVAGGIYFWSSARSRSASGRRSLGGSS